MVPRGRIVGTPSLGVLVMTNERAEVPGMECPPSGTSVLVEGAHRCVVDPTGTVPVRGRRRCRIARMRVHRLRVMQAKRMPELMDKDRADIPDPATGERSIRAVLPIPAPAVVLGEPLVA